MSEKIKKLTDALGGTQAKAASALGISQPFMSYLASGDREISPELAVKAEIATKGQVKRVDLLPELFGELDYNQTEAA